MAASNAPKDTDEKPDAETAPGAQTSAAAKGKALAPTHTNAYGDPVHVPEKLHAFVEARGYSRL